MKQNLLEESREIFYAIAKEIYKNACENRSCKIPAEGIKFFVEIINNEEISLGEKNKILQLPSLAEIGKIFAQDLDYNLIFRTREFFQKSIALAGEFDLVFQYDLHRKYKKEDGDFGVWKNLCLEYLSELGTQYLNVVFQQFQDWLSLLDAEFALQKIYDMARYCKVDLPEKKIAQDIYLRKINSLEMWHNFIKINANSIGSNIIEDLENIIADSRFDKENPSEVLILFDTFGKNLQQFHCGKTGYQFVLKGIIILRKHDSKLVELLFENFAGKERLCKSQQQFMEDVLCNFTL